MLIAGACLALGTAQLGMPYGVANVTGKPAPDVARDMVGAALAAGVRQFDTSRHYGDSEIVLGAALADLDPAGSARVTSTLPSDADAADAGAVLAAAAESVRRLGRPLDALLLHDEAALDGWEAGVGRAMEGVLDAGLAGALGVSVYSLSRARQALGIPILTRLQLPSSVLDRRFARDGAFDAAARRGGAGAGRSVFLQGLLLMPADRLPVRLDAARPYVARFQACAAALGLSPAMAALGFARAMWPDACLVVGAETREQLTDNIRAVAVPLPDAAVAALGRAFDVVPETVVNPCLWPKT